MKASCTIVASVFAASTVAFSSAGDSFHHLTTTEGFSCESEKGDKNNNNNNKSRVSISSGKEKFAPRFDGLRFIETLVTGHR